MQGKQSAVEKRGAVKGLGGSGDGHSGTSKHSGGSRGDNSGGTLSEKGRVLPSGARKNQKPPNLQKEQILDEFPGHFAHPLRPSGKIQLDKGKHSQQRGEKFL